MQFLQKICNKYVLILKCLNLMGDEHTYIHGVVLLRPSKLRGGSWLPNQAFSSAGRQHTQQRASEVILHSVRYCIVGLDAGYPEQ